MTPREALDKAEDVLSSVVPPQKEGICLNIPDAVAIADGYMRLATTIQAVHKSEISPGNIPISVGIGGLVPIPRSPIPIKVVNGRYESVPQDGTQPYPESMRGWYAADKFVPRAHEEWVELVVKWVSGQYFPTAKCTRHYAQFTGTTWVMHRTGSIPLIIHPISAVCTVLFWRYLEDSPISFTVFGEVDPG